jgi:hypothetical protein
VRKPIKSGWHHETPKEWEARTYITHIMEQSLEHVVEPSASASLERRFALVVEWG